jgi:signal transduction histidine kinase
VNPTLSSVLTALLWSAIGAAAVWLVTTPLRRRMPGGTLASVVLAATAASLGALLGSVHAMLLPMHDELQVVVISAVAGSVAAVVTVLAVRRTVKDRAVLRAAVADVAAGRVPGDGGRRLGAELEQVRRELRATAAKLAGSREREQALEASRRELVAWASHDLRTPLAGIRAISEALEDGVADDPELYYKQLRLAVDRLSGMVDDLFQLSRIQAGAFSRDVEAVALDDIASDCLAALEPVAAAKGVALTGSTAGSATVTGNGPDLNRALTNLVANAIRHTPASGQVVVRVGLMPATNGQPARAEVTVQDECGGIPADDLGRVFDVGFRGEMARTPAAMPSAGAGLGLAITRGIVEAHSGTVSAENAPGGCRFTVRLPLARG